MTETGWIFATGIIIATISYVLKNFTFEPLLEYREVKGKIQNRLKYYSNKITNSGLPEDVVKDARAELRRLSCDLEEKYWAISFKKVLVIIRLLESREIINKTAKSLIYLSNSSNERDTEIKNHHTIEEIKNNLGLFRELDSTTD